MGEFLYSLVELLLIDNISEQLALLNCPVAVRKIGLANAQPFEHAAAATHPRNQFGNSFPILKAELFVSVVDMVLIAVLGDDPHEDFNVFLTPILLQFLILDHLVDAP